MEDNHHLLSLRLVSSCLPPLTVSDPTSGETGEQPSLPLVSRQSPPARPLPPPPVSPSPCVLCVRRLWSNPAKIMRVVSSPSTGQTWTGQVAPSTGATQVFLSPVAFLVLRMCFNSCHSVSVPRQGKSHFYRKVLFHFKSFFMSLV